MTLRELWDTGVVTIGGWCTLPDPFSAELMGRAGFDWVCIDTQHGLPGPDHLVQMLQALAITGTPAFVRVGWNDPHLIMRALDCGAQGVIVPMVNTADEARRAVAACRYPPEGNRSWGPIRASLGIPDYSPVTANRGVVCAVMIETVEAMHNLDAILEVPGVDAVYVGPSDLALSLGLTPAADPVEPAHSQAVETILAGCLSHGIVAGIHCGSVDGAHRWRDRGFRMLNVNNDATYVRATAAGVLKALRRTVPATEASPSGYA